MCTTKEKYPLPNMGIFLIDWLDEQSSPNLQKGYYQVPLTVADVAKTAIIMPFGFF
jgi:hypothetical protein